MVVSQGVVVEQGKHDELMALEGAYHKLVTNQVAVGEQVLNSGIFKNNNILFIIIFLHL